MPNSSTNKVFEAESLSIQDLYLTEGGSAGFRIPLYQRQYDWSEENISRLFEDILSGLYWCRKEYDSLTFIGAIIIQIEEETKERSFSGRSLSVIDGQQRLTTISLIATVLYLKLKEINNDFNETKDFDTFPNWSDVKEWIIDELDNTLEQLCDLIFGSLKSAGGDYMKFPRVVRQDEDNRAKNIQDVEYRSIIAKYLNSFSKYIDESTTDSFTYDFSEKKRDEVVFKRNINTVKEHCNFIDSEDENSIALLEKTDFEKKGLRKLFKQLQYRDEDIANKIMSFPKNHNGTIINAYRLLAFSNYLLNYVQITLVVTHNEKYAFDIFDSLNTTGEPLTAIQTFKPQVIRVEEENGKYKNSISEQHFSIIENYIDQFTSSDSKQKESKDLIIPFALYIGGVKESRNLNEQRRFLKSNYNNIVGLEGKRRFVQKLSEVAKYKKNFWIEKGIENLSIPIPDRDLTLLCLKFLKDLSNTLTIPILCRFYFEAEIKNDLSIFSNAVKSLTAYVVLRRGVTGGTGGIDSDLRSIMSQGERVASSDSKKLCCGFENPNELVDNNEFASYLRDWLAKNRIEITNKASWVAKIKNQGLYSSSKPLCRFIILAASHNSRISNNISWKLVKMRPSMETDYLTIQKWNSKELATIEHIAPQRTGNDEWDNEIYTQPFLKDTIGNLSILPQIENTRVGNKNWKHKQWLYKAFAAESEEEIKKIFEDAERAGSAISKKNKDLIIEQGVHLPIIKSIGQVQEWTAELIKNRSENIAELAWEELSLWLNYPAEDS